jgi:anti-sigma regulatory factor (Ser/Thr protein kinase)
VDLVNGPQLAVRIDDVSAVGHARRVAQEIAALQQMELGQQAKLAIVVTEAATNLAKHADGGELLLAPADGGVEVIAIDTGPGMLDIARAFRDGYSTAGSPGGGLGAIARQATRYDVYSLPDRGTILYAQVAPAALSGRASPRFEVGAVCLPHPDEQVCGDAWAFVEHDQAARLIVADGLGHGTGAQTASLAAIAAFRAASDQPPEEILRRVHDALRATRGAAASVASIVSVGAAEVSYAGVGNVTGAVLSDGSVKNLISHDGTLGHTAQRIRAHTHPLPAVWTLVMASDGLLTQWRLDTYPGILAHHPSVIAAVLYRDFRRQRDDITVVVVKPAGGAP